MTVRKETGNDAKSKKIFFKQNITFSQGVTRIEDLPKETSAEVAFFGRSNVGKSSLLNSITDKNKLAYTSKNPGRTRELNFFSLSKNSKLDGLSFNLRLLANRRNFELSLYFFSL